MTSFRDRIPKKPKTSPKPSKHCDLCEKHGGAPKTHNTNECKRYRSDGTPKKPVVRSDGKHDHKKRGKSYAQLLEEIHELKHDVRKDQKKKSKKRKRDYASSDSDSDSS